MKITSVVGARPNFMKIAPIARELQRRAGVRHLLVHTGQHYDAAMSDAFFRDLELPQPDFFLGVGSGSHARQTAAAMVAFEEVLERERPDVVLVVGDVNSTLAASVTAVKLGVPLAHVEAGLRSFDRTMPEEINRLLTDAVADLLFVSEESGLENLRREGVAAEKVHFVGNVMIDSLLRWRARAEGLRVWERLGLAPRGYAVLTLHRPANVDDRSVFEEIVAAVGELAREIPVLFPVHPRTRQRIREHGLAELFREGCGAAGARPGAVTLLEPLGYLEFLSLQARAALVLTDSGGIQEETTVLGVPCLTLRENTERPVTVAVGTNVLVGASRARIAAAALAALRGEVRRGARPPLWDGRAAERIVAVLCGGPGA